MDSERSLLKAEVSKIQIFHIKFHCLPEDTPECNVEPVLAPSHPPGQAPASFPGLSHRFLFSLLGILLFLPPLQCVLPTTELYS